MTSGKIRVLQVIDSLKPGGAQAVLRDFLNNRPQSEFEYHLAVLGGPDSTYEFNCPVYYGRISKWNIPQSRNWLAELITKLDINIISSHLYKANLVSPLLARRLMIPLLIMDHSNTLDLNILKLYLGNSTAAATIFRSAHLFLIHRNVKRIIVVSEHTRKLYLINNFNPNFVTTLNCGLDLKRFSDKHHRNPKAKTHFKLPPDAVVIGAVGRLSPEKDYATLIKAAVRLIPERENLYFLLAGDGPEREHLEKLLKKYNLGERFLLPGFVEDVRDLLSASNLFAHTSLSECFPIALMEAMAAGLPIASAASSGALNLFTDRQNALLFPPGDSQALTKQLKELLDNPELSAKLAQDARNTALKNYAIETFATRLEDIYRDVLKT